MSELLPLNIEPLGRMHRGKAQFSRNLLRVTFLHQTPSSDLYAIEILFFYGSGSLSRTFGSQSKRFEEMRMAVRAQCTGVLKVSEVSCGFARCTAASTSGHIAFTTINCATANRLSCVFDNETEEALLKEDHVVNFEVNDRRYVLIDPEEIAATVPLLDRRTIDLRRSTHRIAIRQRAQRLQEILQHRDRARHGDRHSSQIPHPSSSMHDAGRGRLQHRHVIKSMPSRSGGRISIAWVEKLLS